MITIFTKIVIPITVPKIAMRSVIPLKHYRKSEELRCLQLYRFTAVLDEVFCEFSTWT
jgi:hypothetical protein